MKKFVLLLLSLAAGMILNARSVESSEFRLNGGERGELSRNFVRYHTCLKADFEFRKFSPVSVGRGREGLYRSAWLEINETYIIYHECKLVPGKDKNGKNINTFGNVIREAWPHKMKLKGNLSVEIDTDMSTADISVRSGKQVWTKNVKWFGGGEAFVRNDGDNPVKAVISLERRDLENPFWFYCDSYGSYGNSRWLWYTVKDGVSGWMLDNLPGGNSRDMLEAFRNDLKEGKPKYAVWMLGMNDRKDKDGPDAKWLERIQTFISICRENGITPVLTTIPTVPGRNHTGKSAWVRSSGYRFIDWEKAVESDASGNWAEGCLSRDKVHPSAEGAVRLWNRIREDLPELVEK